MASLNINERDLHGQNKKQVLANNMYYVSIISACGYYPVMLCNTQIKPTTVSPTCTIGYTALISGQLSLPSLRGR